MEAALRAIAHPGRRAILELVWDRERTSTEIAATIRLSAPATSQHLAVLREAELVAVRAEGQRRLYRVREDRLADLRAALDAFWGDRLDRLKTAAEEDQG